MHRAAPVRTIPHPHPLPEGEGEKPGLPPPLSGGLAPLPSGERLGEGRPQHHALLAGGDLPKAWRNQPQWRILETQFGLGIAFLTSWQAWRADPHRPALLHVVSFTSAPPTRDALLHAAQAHPPLEALAAELATQWHGLLPGFHRLSFDAGRVLLTLCLGELQRMLRAQRHFSADSIYLSGFDSHQNPPTDLPATLKAVARFARPGTRLAANPMQSTVRDTLTPLGFVFKDEVPSAPHGVFAPTWPRRAAPAVQAALDELAGPPARCAVIGAGLAGAAVAASLARRGWQVTVLDAAAQPAGGASGVPAGVLAPHVSPDDALLSRLTRAGARATWQAVQQAGALLAEGTDWQRSGVLERRSADALRLPEAWQAADAASGTMAESRIATEADLQSAALPPGTPALRHAQAGWLQPARLIAAWLAQPGVRFEGDAPIARIEERDGRFTLHDEQGAVRAQAERVVIAAGIGSRALTEGLPLQAVRGQLAWGPHPPGLDPRALPALPLNGDGHLVPTLPDAQGRPQWLTGSTFEPSVDAAALRPDGRAHNLARLRRLHPALAEALAPAFAGGSNADHAGAVRDWAGVRCASADRRPLVGPLDPARQGLWVCTALGSRGLSFAALCAELLAARWHGEPLPVPAAWARGVDTARVRH